MKQAIRLGAIWILVSLGALPATAGVIRGTVSLKSSRVEATPAATRAVRAPKSDQAAITRAVVYLEEIPDKLEEKLARKAETARIGQAYGKFLPSCLPIAAGTTVEFENQDRVYHNVFSVSQVKRFDIGKYAPRENRQVRFDRPGEIKLFCELDPGEIGYICVTPNHAFTQPDSSGAFELPKLPPGQYRLCAWYPGRSRITRDVEMPNHGDVTLDLHF